MTVDHANPIHDAQCRCRSCKPPLSGHSCCIPLVVRRRWAWSGDYGVTHRGAKWFLFGWLPIWRTKRPVK